MSQLGVLWGDEKPTLGSPTARKRSSHPERNLVHLPVLAWASLHPICRELLIHIPNERKTSPEQGHMLKMMVVKAGVSDLFLAYPSHGYHGYWIELKAPGKKPTPLQAEWLAKVTQQGYKSDWFDNSAKTIEAIQNYLQGPQDDSQSMPQR